MSQNRVLITCRQMQNVFDVFRPQFDAHGLVYDLPVIAGQQLGEDDLVPIIGEYDGMIAGDDEITARVLECATRMRVISKWGIGLDGIDLPAAAALGVKVTNTPGVFGDDVADVAAGYLVMLARQLHRIHASITAGEWWKFEGIALAGRVLGIVGYGTIGSALARRARAFGMTVVTHDPDPAAVERARTDAIEPLSRDELFRGSDFVAICAPLTNENRHLVNRETLGLMRRGSFVVNVARGGHVDEEALVEALQSGQIAAAALDVFESEPLAPDHPLRAFPQCVFGSHNGSNTSDGVLRASARAVENLFEGLGVA